VARWDGFGNCVLVWMVGRGGILEENWPSEVMFDTAMKKHAFGSRKTVVQGYMNEARKIDVNLW
jgi:hypothetical protein